MASLYTGLAATATRLLTSYGQSITFTRTSSTSFNPATGVDTVTTSTYTLNCAAFDYSASELVDGVIEAGDIRLVTEADTAPAIGDTCVIDSATYRVMNVTKQSPAGTPVYYEAQIRR